MDSVYSALSVPFWTALICRTEHNGNVTSPWREKLFPKIIQNICKGYTWKAALSKWRSALLTLKSRWTSGMFFPCSSIPKSAPKPVKNSSAHVPLSAEGRFWKPYLTVLFSSYHCGNEALHKIKYHKITTQFGLHRVSTNQCFRCLSPGLSYPAVTV